MIAVSAHALGGDSVRAASWAANVRERNATLTRTDFFRSFPIKSETMRTRIGGALANYGF
jgi:hypothetical protein